MLKMAGPFKIVGLFLVLVIMMVPTIHTKYDRYS
jgi:hypothetical protein